MQVRMGVSYAVGRGGSSQFRDVGKFGRPLRLDKRGTRRRTHAVTVQGIDALVPVYRLRDSVSEARETGLHGTGRVAGGQDLVVFHQPATPHPVAHVAEEASRPWDASSCDVTSWTVPYSGLRPRVVRPRSGVAVPR